MRIVPIVSALILSLSANAAFARRSRCRQVECECVPVVCSSASACARPTTVCGIPQPTIIALAESAIPAAPTLTAEALTSVMPVLKRELGGTDPTLDAYLAEWEQASSKFRWLDCEFKTFRYIPTFQVEKRGQGTIAVEQNGPARYRLIPVAINPGDVSGKRNYKLEACDPECWQWTTTHLFKIDEQRRIYEMIRIPPRDRSDSSGFFRFMEELRELPFAKPFLLGMPAKELKGRYNVKLLKETDTELWMEFIPRQAQDAANFEKATLVLDRQKWVAKAMRSYDPTGCLTTFVFSNVQVNSEGGEDLSKPKVEGYRQVLSGPQPESDK